MGWGRFDPRYMSQDEEEMPLPEPKLLQEITPKNEKEYEAACQICLNTFLAMLMTVPIRDFMIATTLNFISNQSSLVRYAEENEGKYDFGKHPEYAAILVLFGDMVLLSLFRKECPREGIDPLAVSALARCVPKEWGEDCLLIIKGIYGCLMDLGGAKDHADDFWKNYVEEVEDED